MWRLRWRRLGGGRKRRWALGEDVEILRMEDGGNRQVLNGLCRATWALMAIKIIVSTLP